MQPNSLGHSVEQPTDLSVDAPTVRERTGRRATSGPPRSARQDRAYHRRTALSSVAAELSAVAAVDDLFVAAPTGPAVAVIEPPRRAATRAVLDRLATYDVDAEPEPAADPSPASIEVFLTGRPRLEIAEWEGGPVPATTSAAPEIAAAAAPPAVHVVGDAAPPPPLTVVPEPAARAVVPPGPAAEEPAVLDADDLRALVQLEAVRAEADVLNTRVASAQAARAEAERRLAEMQDEIRFLRAEVQMVGQPKRTQPGPLRRTLRALTGRRRPVVPANNPKKERLGF